MAIDSAIYESLVVATTAIAVCIALVALVRVLQRQDRTASLLAPIIAAFAVRVIATVGISLTPVSASLRGGDESIWLSHAATAADAGVLSSESLELLSAELHSWVFAVQIFAVGQTDLALRIVQIGIAVAGIALIAAAVRQLANPRAGWLTAWVLALAPANVFFSSILHKEPLLILAGGLVAFGGARLWSRGELLGILPMAAGCLVALGTRPYAGWFLIAASAAVGFHGSLRHAGSRVATIPLAVVLAGAIAASIPVVWDASEEDALPAKLQRSQSANATNTEANLSFERVDFATRTAIVTNLPMRVQDVLLRPYPWQIGNLSQQLGVLGGLFTLTVLLLLIRYAWLSRGAIMARAGPFVYIGAAVIIGYSLSAGNAGTAFRYRTHILLFLVAALLVLRENVLQRRAASTSTPVEADPDETESRHSPILMDRGGRDGPAPTPPRHL